MARERASSVNQYEVPATFANRITITHGPWGTRLTFGESSDGSDKEERPLVAVLLPVHVTAALVNLLQQVLADSAERPTQGEPDAVQSS